MANKREKALREKENILKKYQSQLKKILPLYIVAAVVGATALLCYFFAFAAVDNSAYGIEVKVSGFAFAIAALTGKYSSTDKIYGDIAVPFNYYAEAETAAVGTLALVSIVALVAAIALTIVTRVTKKQEINFAAVICSAVCLITTALAFFTALSMKNAEILSVYCGGNPKCSIVSFAFVAIIVETAFLVIQIICAIKFIKLKINNKN